MAKDDEQLLKAWTNTTIGLTWEEKGDAPDWGVLFDRREKYKIGIVPKGGYVLTAGVDVQNDRLELEIVAWGKITKVGLLITEQFTAVRLRLKFGRNYQQS